MKTPFIPNDIIGRIIINVVGPNVKFQPTREFYKLIGIGQKRFWQLYRGEVAPTTDEITAVASYFKKQLSVEFPLVQLSLFDKNGEILKAEV